MFLIIILKYIKADKNIDKYYTKKIERLNYE